MGLALIAVVALAAVLCIVLAFAALGVRMSFMAFKRSGGAAAVTAAAAAATAIPPPGVTIDVANHRISVIRDAAVFRLEEDDDVPLVAPTALYADGRGENTAAVSPDASRLRVQTPRAIAMTSLAEIEGMTPEASASADGSIALPSIDELAAAARPTSFIDRPLSATAAALAAAAAAAAAHGSPEPGCRSADGSDISAASTLHSDSSAGSASSLPRGVRAPPPSLADSVTGAAAAAESTAARSVPATVVGPALLIPPFAGKRAAPAVDAPATSRQDTPRPATRRATAPLRLHRARGATIAPHVGRSTAATRRADPLALVLPAAGGAAATGAEIDVASQANSDTEVGNITTISDDLSYLAACAAPLPNVLRDPQGGVVFVLPSGAENGDGSDAVSINDLWTAEDEQARRASERHLARRQTLPVGGGVDGRTYAAVAAAAARRDVPRIASPDQETSPRQKEGAQRTSQLQQEHAWIARLEALLDVASGSPPRVIGTAGGRSADGARPSTSATATSAQAMCVLDIIDQSYLKLDLDGPSLMDDSALMQAAPADVPKRVPAPVATAGAAATGAAATGDALPAATAAAAAPDASELRRAALLRIIAAHGGAAKSGTLLASAPDTTTVTPNPPAPALGDTGVSLDFDLDFDDRSTVLGTPGAGLFAPLEFDSLFGAFDVAGGKVDAGGGGNRGGGDGGFGALGDLSLGPAAEAPRHTSVDVAAPKAVWAKEMVTSAMARPPSASQLV
ncbi:hypothetical protein CXG81DRAFT_16507 [Caulochytrium protostelioides]|uniref:Uncharacterized protein n=1 Tax=Caulochytrium protostelioides TaxID=1555241 RepID=A0A4P9XEX1_9FUNG|nr:hypothetical protein CXG81DRAFT_16507 [Caulochytrium protostelioides]|eukprot:RKP04082.1 hypothetical protein CXG81DRAFT_16507 [Caulochytrium protostelioides]